MRPTTDPSTNDEESMTDSKAAPAPQTLSDAARRILGESQERQEPQANANPQSGENKQQSVTIKVGGVERVVPIDELTKLYEDRDRVGGLNAELDKRLAALGDLNGLKSLQEAMGRMGAAQRAKLVQLLEGGDEDLEEQGGADEGGDERLTLDDHQPQSRPSREVLELRQQVAKLTEFAQVIAARENQRDGDSRRRTLTEQVEQELKAFPLFTKGDAADAFRELAKDSVLAQLAADPKASPKALIEQAAQKLQTLNDRKTESVAARLGARPPEMSLPQIAGGINAKALKTGAIRAAAARVLNGI